MDLHGRGNRIIDIVGGLEWLGMRAVEGGAVFGGNGGRECRERYLEFGGGILG